MAERTTVSAEDTLVRYDNPVLVTKRPEKLVSSRIMYFAILLSVFTYVFKPIQTSPRDEATIQPCIPTEAKRETEEILNAILPPREWEEDGQIWTQKVTVI